MIIGLVSLFVVVLASLIVTRVATQMLVTTGLSYQSARFQARSAFSGAGFTTSESEAIMHHPVRRRIIMWLILVGNAGIVTFLGSLLLAFAGSEDSADALLRILVVLVLLVAMLRLAASSAADRLLTRVIQRALRRWTDLDVRDYAALLKLSRNWVVGEMEIVEGDWLCGYTLHEVALPDEGVLVLGIERSDGRWVGAPKGSARFLAGDLVILYGQRDTIERIDARERTAEGEHDWLSSQVEFTMQYLDQQREEETAESSVDDPDSDVGEDHSPQLRVGEQDDGP